MVSLTLRVPVRLMVNKPNLVPNRNMSGFIDVFSSECEQAIYVSFIFFKFSQTLPFMLLRCTLYHIHNGSHKKTPSLVANSIGSFNRTKCDLSVVSDSKTEHTPCCCWQWILVGLTFSMFCDSYLQCLFLRIILILKLLFFFVKNGQKRGIQAGLYIKKTLLQPWWKLKMS